MQSFKGQFADRKKYTTIKGLSDVRRLPRLGKIRLGIKKKNAKGVEYPAEVDYFVCPPEVEAIYGEQPRELDIYVPINDVSEILSTAFKWYGKSHGVKCIGNGETALRSFGEEGMKEIECPCDQLKTDNNPKGQCSMIAHFMFILPKVNMGGVYQIDTGSINSIINIQSGLEYTAELVHSVTGHHRFNMVPLKLRRIKQITHGSGREETHYPLSVEMKLTVDELNAMSANQRLIPGRVIVETSRLTPANEVEYKDEEDDIPSEYKEVEPENEQPEVQTGAVTESATEKPDSTRVENEKPPKSAENEPQKDQLDTDPYKMKKDEIIAYLANQKGKRYRYVTFNNIKLELFGETAKMSTVKKDELLKFYERLEQEAIRE